jgi:hypothetical protein
MYDDDCNATIDERVARGVALLDRRVPDWRARIKVGTLDIVNSGRCVIGQVFAHQSYSDALDELDVYRASDFGFDARRSGEYGALTRAWVAVITTAQ